MTETSVTETAVAAAPAVEIATQPALELPAPIVRVLVLEDRAQITRRATSSLSSGHAGLQVSGVTPLAADRSLRGRIRRLGPGEDPRLLDVRLRRQYVVRSARPADERELTARLERLVEGALERRDRAGALLHERRLIHGAADALRLQIGDRLAVGPFEPGWAEDIEQLWRRRDELESELLRLGEEQEDQKLQLRALERERAQLLQPHSEYTGSLQMEVYIPSAGEFELEWEYQVPCALWRPEYGAELSEENGRATARWESAGTIWQQTGEDWTGVELGLSTMRPALGAELPLLTDDPLTARAKTDRERKIVEVASRDETVAEVEKVQQIRSSATPPGLDDGGEARTYVLPERVSVPSDGAPHTLPFDHWSADAECELLCCPERASYVFLRALLTNPSALPLLAGPVRLVQNGGYVGRSQIAYVAPGERFELSWGSEDGLVALRDVERHYEETGLRNRRTYAFAIRDYLANHTAAARRLRLVERIPISEIAEVEVELEAKGTSTGYHRDAAGRITWEVRLAAGEERTVELSFRVRMPQHVHWQG